MTTENPATTQLLAELRTAPEPASAVDGAGWQVAVETALAAVRAGRMIVVTDDEDRENEGDLVVAAQDATPELVAFMVRHTTGILCTPMTGARLDELGIPLMITENREAHGTAFTVTVDHLSTTTGVSAADRAATARALADPATRPTDLRRPGHVFPLRGRDGGVLKRAGHTEAALDLMRLAGKHEVAIISELVNDDGSMSRPGDVAAFAIEHDLVTVSIADLVRYRCSTERLVERSGSATIPTLHGDFLAVAYTSILDGDEHLALVLGDIHAAAAEQAGVLVRVHSECLTGDVLGSLRCDCGTQLTRAMAAINEQGCGVLIYLRGHEGRGVGLGHKLRAYSLQERGADTVDANLDLGLPVDSREYGIGAQMLTDLGVRRMRLITNNPTKYGGLIGYDIEIVSRISLPTVVTSHNVKYLKTKRDRMGHSITIPVDQPCAAV
jgi:3,4-dihydroxy 2-butanone 4-phosphate synthase/GTP cyclohydrolase II